MTDLGLSRARDGRSWIAAAPALFVLLWSTGFIGGKLGLPYAEPFTFLALRFGIAAALLATAALVTGAPWPASPRAALHVAVAGVLIHGVYIAGVFSALDRGVPAGLTALIVGLQPIITAVAAGPYLHERVTARQWLGLAIGLVGVALVVTEQLRLDARQLAGAGFAVAALLGITAGTLYQKRHGQAMDLRTGSAIQFAAAALVMLLPALLWERMTISWTAEFAFALGWLILVLSIGAITLLHLLIRRGAAAKVASLFYLVPPVTALLGFFMFEETLGPTALAGMAVAVLGVALVVRG